MPARVTDIGGPGGLRGGGLGTHPDKLSARYDKTAAADRSAAGVVLADVLVLGGALVGLVQAGIDAGFTGAR